MSPAAKPSKAARAPKAPKPVPPWRRAEAGQYRSSDDRFTVGSEGPSRWFVTDDASLDELGLARTIGPFPTLEAAKAAADAQRGHAPEASPLADRLAGPTPPATANRATAREKESPRRRGHSAPAAEPSKRAERPGRAAPEPPQPAPPRSWLDTLADEDRAAARRARRLIAVLEAADVQGAEALVRRDVVGNQPVVAARLLAARILRAIDSATRPAAIDRLARGLAAGERDAARPRLAASAAVEAVLGVLAGSKAEQDLPGWRLVERDGPPGEPREIVVTARELRDAAGSRGTVD